MSQNSTGYILGFAAGVCLVCSVFVSGAAVSLKDRQVANELVDKQKKVLDVSGALRPGESATMEPAAINELYAERVVPRLINLADGTYLEAVDGKEGFVSYSFERDDGTAVEGEIEVASPCVMQAYDRNPEATQRSIVDGRLRTGDLGPAWCSE